MKIKHQPEVKEFDERGGVPSASSMDRLYACAGSHQASADIEDVQSEDATKGSRIHSLLAGEDIENPTKEELSMAVLCYEMAERLVKDEFGNTIDECDVVTKEERLWSRGGTYSGKADLIVSVWDETLVIDYKTGRGEVEDAASNKQLRALAVLAMKHSNEAKMKRIGVAIVQPLVTSNPVVVWYTAEEIEIAREEVDGVVKAATAWNPKRIAGDIQCRHCKAKSRCPEANAEVDALVEVPPSIMALTSEQLARRLDACKVAESVIDATREEAKRRLHAGEDVAGWELKMGYEREAINKPEEVYSRFEAEGGTAAQFMEAVTITKTRLQDAMRLVTGAKGKQLTEKMESLLAGCTSTKQNAPSLVKQKGHNDNG